MSNSAITSQPSTTVTNHSLPSSESKIMVGSGSNNSSLTASILDFVHTPIGDRSIEIQDPESSQCMTTTYLQILNTLKDVALEAKAERSNLKETVGNLEILQKEIESNKETLVRDSEAFKSAVAEHKKNVDAFNEVKSQALKQNVGDISQKMQNPASYAAIAIKCDLPLMQKRYEDLLKNDTRAARVEFVKFFQATIQGVLANAQLGTKTAEVDFEKMKGDVTASIKGAFESQVSKEILEFMELSIKQAKSESASSAPLSRKEWACSLLRSLDPRSSTFTFSAAVGTAGYVAGSSTDWLLSLAPERINDLILAIQQYAGSSTVPLFCFALGYMLYLLVQGISMAKERFLPVDEKVKVAEREVSLKAAFSRA